MASTSKPMRRRITPMHGTALYIGPAAVMTAGDLSGLSAAAIAADVTAWAGRIVHCVITA